MNSSTDMSKLDPQISFKHHFSQQFMKDFQYNTLISENMCFLDQIEINISYLAIITSPERLFWANALQSCNSEDIVTAGARFELTIELLYGSDIDSNALKKSLLSIFTRGYQGYVIVCSQVCSNLVLNLAYQLGFGSDLYFWFTLSQPASMGISTYPKNSFAVTWLKETMNDTQEQKNQYKQ